MTALNIGQTVKEGLVVGVSVFVPMYEVIFDVIFYMGLRVSMPARTISEEFAAGHPMRARIGGVEGLVSHPAGGIVDL